MTAPAATPARPGRAQLVFTFTLVAVIWGSTWLVIKDQVSQVPPGWTVTWRFVVAAVAMIAWTALRGESLRLPRASWGIVGVVGVLQVCANFEFVYRSEIYLTSGIVAVFYALLMVPNALLSRAFLGTPLSGRFVAGSAVAIAGIALLFVNEYRMAPLPAAGSGSGVALGVVLAVCGLLSVSVANVLQSSPAAQRVPILPMTAWGMVAGLAANAAFSWIVSGPPVFDPRPEYFAGIVYLGLIGSVVAFPLYFGLIRHLGAGPAAYNGVAVPVVAMALSTLFEGYRWSGLAAGGAALALAGLAVALSGRK